jgi:pimeloyl-ACP methyl ester carboxylesterase
MKTRIRTAAFAAMLAIATLLPGVARAQPTIPGCNPGLLPAPLPHGALAAICMPPVGWNGKLVVFAHGYVAFNQPPTFSNLYLPNGDGTYTFLPTLIQSLGYAFATTTYRQNGLAILEGAQDVRDLVNAFSIATGSVPLRTYMAGVSEGGLVAALLAEQSPELFTSALAACGPIGSFREQIEYFGDFRVLFDYFFPGLIPGSPISVPQDVMDNWPQYMLAIQAALATHPDRALELMRVAKTAYDITNPATIANTTLDLLWYNVFATNDAVHKLGGNPYGNRLKWYFGSSNDLRLNLLVARFTASRTAVAALHAYKTSGDLSIPLVTLHTTGDDVIPFRQELFYLAKVDLSVGGRFVPLPVFRYGHCNFTPREVLGAFGLMVKQP